MLRNLAICAVLLSCSAAFAQDKGFLGVRLAFGDGATVDEVFPDSPAAKAGLQVGDRVTAIGEKEILTSEQMPEILGGMRPGTKVELTIERGDEEMKVEIALARRTVRWFLTQKDPPRVPGGVISLGGGTIGGRFTNSGNLIVHQRSSVVAGDFQQAWTGLLDVQIDRRDDPPQLEVTGSAELGGMLNVGFAGIKPKIGDKFEVVSGARTLTGKFDDLMFPDLGEQDGKKLTCILKYDNLDEDRDYDRDGEWDVTVLVVDADTVMPEVPVP